MKTIAPLAILITLTTAIRSEEAVKSLPVFASGPHQGKHSAYQHEKFTAWMSSNGVCWVQPVDQDKPVGRPFIALWVRPYTIVNGLHQERGMATFSEFSAPGEIPKTGGSVSFSGMLENDVPFQVNYEFKGDTIIASGGCKDPRDIATPTRFRFVSSFKNIAGIGESPTDEQIRTKCEGMFLVLRFAKSSKESSLPLATANMQMVKQDPLDEAVLTGTHRPREIVMKPEGKDGDLFHYCYSGNSLWQDFMIQYIAPGKRIQPRSTRASLTVR